MTSARAEVAGTPPYAPWGTFYNFLVTLKSSVIPPQIDSSVMSRMSGSAQAQVRAALRFFDLIDDAGIVQPRLRALVSASGTREEWSNEWGVILYEGYRPIVGDLDTDNATLKQLADRFRENAGVGGSVLRKAIRFYLDALKSTGADYSPHFRVRSLGAVTGDRGVRGARNGGRSATPRRGAAAVSETPAIHHHSVNLHAGPDDFVIKLPGRPAMVIPIPADLRDAEWNYIDQQVRGFMNLRGDREREEAELRRRQEDEENENP